MKDKLTSLELKWIVYDIGNSAFILLCTTIIPIYFNSISSAAGIAESDYLTYWSYATSIATIIVVFAGPIFGTLSDYKDKKKRYFFISALLGALGLAAFWIPGNWKYFLLLFVCAKVFYSLSLVFYDSMLNDVTTDERMDNVSSVGYALGYIGSCVPFILCLGLVLSADALGISMELAMAISFGIVAVWWIAMSMPLLRSYRQKYYVARKPHAVAESFKRIGVTLRNVRKEKKVFLFLLAFFFYIDGVYTIIDMATAYGSALGLDSTGLLLALLVTQFVAFPFAILFGRLAQKFSTDKLIMVCIVAYLGIAVFAMFLTTQTQFWILAVFVGMFQGGIQALSRSYFTKIIPAEHSGEYFGLLDICGKGASFMGTTVVSVVSQLTENVNMGVGMISVFFVIGIILFHATVKQDSKSEKAEEIEEVLKAC